ncbi:aquaporin-like protein [Aureobasidium subglaciale]|nr:aquaporin-like protein [Aureobasidium subglaciale]KAI5227202.1 aquaporin-like protein [Aureobasidium subglaciale]KAI5230523.1 aquaporin-like protein [Aureobasidium subglaciale]KAI5264990.1 aquaporin-like protein [Aureobasidium subglaciale]
MNLDRPGKGLTLPFMKYRENNHHEHRLAGFGWLPNKIRNQFIAVVGEFVGTFLFLFFAFSATQVANAATGNTSENSDDGSITQAPNTSALLYIALAFGFSLAVNAWVFFRITGGLFNPAVTLALCLIGACKWTRGALVFVGQILGAIAAAGIVSCLFPAAMNVSTTLGGGTSIVRGLFIEMFLTAMLVFTILMLAAEKHKGTFLAPIGIGLALFVAELTGVFFTGGSLNPARSFGPCVILHSFPGYHWIYWLGPLLGSVLSVGFYKFIKTLEYETANPGQDFNDKEAEVFQVDEDTATTGADVARPNVAIGRSEYIADGRGIYHSQDVRQAVAAPRAPANYGNTGYGNTHPSGPAPALPPIKQVSGEENAIAPGRGNGTLSGTTHDGADSDRTRDSLNAPRDAHRAPDHVNDEKRRRSSSYSGPHHQEKKRSSSDRYRSSNDAERGDLGGHYKVSGL